MADWGRGQSKGRVGTWDVAERRRRALAWTGTLPDFGTAATQRLHNWIIADTGPGHLLPWLPIAFGFGIALYFTAGHEPAWWAGSGLAAVCSAVAVLARARPIAFPIALACTAIAGGFAVATFTTMRVAHPVLARPAGNVAISGFVEVREERERTDRIVVRVLSIEAARLQQKPDRVRISIKKGTAPEVGAYITFRARLSPPLEPLRPGSYDFARDLYFQGIGATGFVLGAIKPAEAPPTAAPGLWLKYAAAVQGLRDSIDARIRADLPGDRGSIASALITGKRDAITTPINDAMYISSLAHVLSISGYHLQSAVQD
jgi:competence protein ComEC